MSVPDERSRNPFRPLRWVAALCVASGLLLLGTISCRKPSTGVSNGPSEKEECGTILDSAISMAQPLNLGLTTSIEAVVNRLNDWKRTCPDAKKIPAELDAESKKLLAAVLSEKELTAMQSDVFDELDARHVRNNLVFVRIAHAVTNASPSDLDQVVDLFYYVVRNMELEDRKPEAAPRPVFRAMLFGRGTTADRTWLFAALLRQLKMSAVVLSPQKSPPSKGDAKAPWLVGVLLNGKIYLFDMRLGLPIPAADDHRSNPLIRKPATLAQFVADPQIVKSLSTGDFKYPLTADDLKKPRVQLVGHRSVWSPRMKRLYATGHVRSPARAGETIGRLKVELFDELGGKQGVIARAVEFGNGLIERDAIGIWPYPHRQIAAFATMNESQRTEMANLERTFEVPREPVIDKEKGTVATDKLGNPVLGPQSRLQLKARIRHMMGDYDKAVTTYVSVRSQVENIKDTYRELPFEVMDAAKDDAKFWTGLCKYELSDLSTAGGIFTDVMNTSRRWSQQARFLLALCHVKQEQFPLARSEVEALIKLNSPQAHGYALLLERWKPLGKKPAEKQ